MKGEAPSTSTATSAEVISCNEDILLEILILLPALSLIRFKSVSKHWYALISDASFRQLHTRRHRRPQTFFLLSISRSQFYQLNPSSKNFVPFRLNFDDVKIRQSCNGLLLLQCGYPNKDYYVYNPTTGESRNLLLPEREKFGCLFLAFDPLKSPHYKVVCLWFVRYTSLLYAIEVYDSETHKWKHLENVYYNLHPLLRDWVYSGLDNSIYLLPKEKTGTLYCFDVEKLMFRLPFFEDLCAERRLNLIGIKESFGHVHCIFHDDAINHLVVHEMTEKNDECSFKHLFEFDITPCCPGPDKICFLGVIRGEGKDNSLVYHIPGKIMAYRFYERRFEELFDLSTQRFYEDGRLQFEYGDSHHFVESLAPV